MAKGAESVDVARHVGIKYDQNFNLSDGDTWLLRIDNEGRLILSPSAYSSPESMDANKLTATGDGTTQQLPDKQCVSVVLKSRASNAGNIYIGGAPATGTNGYELTPGETVSMNISNLSEIYVYFEKAGDVLNYLYTHN